ncbi:magnesium protoporphyrin IX methyltransferase, chloroplastic [Tanacetum coccineum]
MKGKRKCENIDDKLHFPDNEFVTVNENVGFDTLHKLMNPTLKTLYADPKKGSDYRRGMMIQKKFLDKWLIGCLNLWTITLDVKSDDTIDSVTVEVESKTGILPHQQLLICGGKQLTEGRVLACYNIQKKSIVDLKIDIHHLNALRDKGKEELHNKEGLQMPKFEADGMIAHLASLVDNHVILSFAPKTNRVIVSFAPKTFYYDMLKRNEELFPGPLKATRAYIHSEADIEQALQKVGWKIRKMGLTTIQFYFSRIVEVVGMKDEAKNVPHLRGQKLSRQAKINLDYRPVSPEPASGSLLAKRMLVSLSHDQTNGVKDQKEERGK